MTTDTEKMYDNVADIQAIFDEAVTLAEVPFTVGIDIGEDIIDVSDKHIVLGLSQTVVQTISKISYYNEVIPTAKEAYIAQLAEVLKACAKPTDIVKQNTSITKELGVFSRKSLVKLIRNIVTRRVAYTRVGQGYFGNDDYFTVIEKVLLTEEEEAKAVKAENGEAYIIDNTNATIAEKNAGKTKILVKFRVSPFNDNNETVAVDIKTIPGIVSANEGK